MSGQISAFKAPNARRITSLTSVRPTYGEPMPGRIQGQGLRQFLEPFVIRVVVEQHVLQGAHRIGRVVSVEDSLRGRQEALVVHAINVWGVGRKAHAHGLICARTAA